MTADEMVACRSDRRQSAGGRDHARLRWRSEAAFRQARQGQIARLPRDHLFARIEVPVFLLMMLARMRRRTLARQSATLSRV